MLASLCCFLALASGYESAPSTYLGLSVLPLCPLVLFLSYTLHPRCGASCYHILKYDLIILTFRSNQALSLVF